MIVQKRIFFIELFNKNLQYINKDKFDYYDIFIDSSRSLMESLNTSEVPMKRLDLSSVFEGSVIFRHTQGQLQPLMHSMAGTVKHKSSLFTNCIDQYATNALWQVRYCTSCSTIM